jgi:hypothetical protein
MTNEEAAPIWRLGWFNLGQPDENEFAGLLGGQLRCNPAQDAVIGSFG